MYRRLIIFFFSGISCFVVRAQEPVIITVTGSVPSSRAGLSLIHEHLLVDFVGAEKYSRDRWQEEKVVNKVLPFLTEAQQEGVITLFDCTPNYLGRDVRLLLRLSKESKVQIITNTGLYGGSDNKYLPAYAFTETAEQLAERWIEEFKNGIDNSSVRPGFIKISVNPGSLSEISKKLITAAALTHRATGLTIMSHTGPVLPAREQLEILKQQGVNPAAFVWVHAQNEKQPQSFIDIGRMGAWVSLDGVQDNNVEWYVKTLALLKQANVFQRVLVSHDAGWFDPGKPEGGEFRPFTTIFRKLIPALLQAGFTKDEINRLLVENPAEAFSLSIRGN